MTATAARRPQTLATPRAWPVRASDLVALAVGNGFLIAAMWVRHGALDQLGTLSGVLTAAGQLTALLGTYLVLIQLVLMSRSPWLDQLFGVERLANAHRWLGFASVVLIGGHGVLTTIGYAMGDRLAVTTEAWTLLTTYPFVLMATVGMGLFILVAVTSVRIARRRLSYETWYGLHLYAYLAVALAFAHQVVVGTDFSDDPVARIYWFVLLGLVAASFLAFRVGQPVALSWRHQLRVANVVRESPTVTSIYMTGRDLDRLPVRAGQYFLWRFLTHEGWWRAHPFSLSAAPNGDYLRVSVKALGDWSSRLEELPLGTRVFVEGPYGITTGTPRKRAAILLVAGGVGITPLRALFESVPAPRGAITLIYRVSAPEDLALRRELDELARLRGATVHYLVGRRGSPEMPSDPLAPAALQRLIPDVASREVYVCGPDGMIATVRRSLQALRVPDRHIHVERFAY
ncbi:MAG TPA: ferredoxin reductase family protein [Candidatus Limnocylindrales bacterium]